MKNHTLIIMIITIFLASCVPTTDTAKPSAEEPLNVSGTASSEPSVNVESEETQSELTQTVPNAIEEPNPHKLPQVAVAKEDLSTRLNIPGDDIEVVKVEYVTWPNAGMGCPQPGMAYTQVPVDGLLIRLSADGVEYNYHSGGSKGPFLCQPSPTVKSTSPELNLQDFITPSPENTEE